MAGNGRFHVAPEQAALRAQANHPDASRGKFGTRKSSAAAAAAAAALGDKTTGDEFGERGNGGELPRTRAGGSGGTNDTNGGVKMVKMSGNKRRAAATGTGTPSELSPSPGPGTAAELDNEDDLAAGFMTGRDDEDDEDDDDDAPASTTTRRKARFPNKRNAQSVGRRKIHIEFIEDRPRRHVTFTKRKSGLMKKAYELSTLTGTDCLVVVVSESGLLYTFSTPALSGVTDHPRGREFLEAALRGDIRGDGTGDVDFGSPGGDNGSAATTTHVNARETESGRGMRRTRSDGDQQPRTGAAGDSPATHHFPTDFQLDPALGALDLPVPPLPYPSQHVSTAADNQQQQLYDIFQSFTAATPGPSNDFGSHQNDTVHPFEHDSFSFEPSGLYAATSNATTTTSSAPVLDLTSLQSPSASNLAAFLAGESTSYSAAPASSIQVSTPLPAPAPVATASTSEDVTRAHEMATRSYRAALKAAESFFPASAPKAFESASSMPIVPTADGSGSSARKRALSAGAGDASELGWERRVRGKSTLAGMGASSPKNTGDQAGKEEEEEESVEERKFRWQKAARDALREAKSSGTIPSFLRAHAFSHYASRSYPPPFDPSTAPYSLSQEHDAMMQASFARMCCRGGVDAKEDLVAAVQEFLVRWLPREMFRNPSFQPGFLPPALGHARAAILSLVDFLEGHDLISYAEMSRVSAVLKGQLKAQAGYEEVEGLGLSREGRLYGTAAKALAEDDPGATEEDTTAPTTATNATDASPESSTTPSTADQGGEQADEQPEASVERIEVLNR